MSVRESEKVDLAKVSRSDRVVCLFAKFLLMFMSATSKTKKIQLRIIFFELFLPLKVCPGEATLEFRFLRPIRFLFSATISSVLQTSIKTDLTYAGIGKGEG